MILVGAGLGAGFVVGLVAGAGGFRTDADNFSLFCFSKFISHSFRSLTGATGELDTSALFSF